MTLPATPELRAAIAAAYQNGQTIAAIARSTGRSPQGIRQILIRAGITRRSHARVTPELRAAIAAAYQNGQTIAAIAAAEGLALGTVHACLRRAGVQMRPARRRPHHQPPDTTCNRCTPTTTDDLAEHDALACALADTFSSADLAQLDAESLDRPDMSTRPWQTLADAINRAAATRKDTDHA